MVVTIGYAPSYSYLREMECGYRQYKYYYIATHFERKYFF